MRSKLVALMALAGTVLTASAQQQGNEKKTSKNNDQAAVDSTQNMNMNSTIAPNDTSTFNGAEQVSSDRPLRPKYWNLQRGINFGNYTMTGSDTSETTKEKNVY